MTATQKLLPLEASARIQPKFTGHARRIWSHPPEGDVVRLTERRRAVLADKFGDLANLALTALFFGQAVGQGSFSLGVAIEGVAIWLVFMVATFFLEGERR